MSSAIVDPISDPQAWDFFTVGGQRSPGIACCGLCPQSLKWTLPQNAAIGDAIQSNAPGQAQIPFAGLAVSVTYQPQHRFFRNDLNARCQIHFLLGQF